MAKKTKKRGLTIAFSSHKSDEYNEKFKAHLKKTCGLSKVEILCYPNFNEHSLAELYNRAIDDAKPGNYIVFVHNDIEIDTPRWAYKLFSIFSEGYDVIGLAGTTNLAENGMWWADRSKMYGIVNHTNGINTWETKFAPEINGVKDVVVIDGVFFAINPETIVNRFDEDFKGFHFYEIPFVFSNFLDGNMIGVTTDVRITHQSVGETDQEWEENRKQFVDKYKTYLPYNLELEDEYKS